MQKNVRFLITLIICVANCCVQLPVTAATSSGCDAVKFIFARGSGEELDDTSYLSWQTALDSRLQSSKLRYSFYELGSQAQNGAKYPAVAVAGSLGGFGNLLGAYISAGQSFDFGKSVLTGRNELKSYIKSVSSICPNTKFILGGYSQGAMVVSGTLNELDASKIIYVATFGDPKLYLPEGAGQRPDACRGKKLSNYRTYVPDCHAYEGALGSYRPYQPTNYIDKLGTWCNGQDMMCSSGLSISDHTSYSSLGLYRNAANVIISKLRLAFPSAFTNFTADDSNELTPHDLLIVLYAAGDMNGLLLAQYKLAAQRLANQVYSLGGRVALYVYGDNSKWNMRKLCDFTCSADEFNAQLAKLTHSLSAVDSYNSGLSSLYRAMSELTWQVGATKSAVLLTPRPYSPVDYNGIRVSDVAELSLSIDPVNIYPMTHANSLEQVQPLAGATNGKAYSIDQINLAVTEITGRPVASLSLETYEGIVGEEMTFAAHSDLDSSKALRYDWDLDANGIFELQNSSAVMRKTYSTPTTGYIQVRVTDQNGYSNTMSANLKITTSIPVSPTITDIQVTTLNATTYRLDFTAQADQVWVAIGDLPMGYLSATHRFLEISDVKARTTVRLIPYSYQSGKGEAVAAVIGPEPADNPENPVVSTQPTQDSTTHVTSGSPNVIMPSDNVTIPTPIVFIPKAPNTGVSPSL